jgi:hypothetical protein
MGKHQRAVSENKYPEQVGQQPKPQVICYLFSIQNLSQIKI